MFKQIKDYFSKKLVDKEFILEYHIKSGDYIKRIVHKTENTDYDELVALALDSVNHGFHQDGIVYNPTIIVEAYIKEKSK